MSHGRSSSTNPRKNGKTNGVSWIPVAKLRRASRSPIAAARLPHNFSVLGLRLPSLWDMIMKAIICAQYQLVILFRRSSHTFHGGAFVLFQFLGLRRPVLPVLASQPMFYHCFASWGLSPFGGMLTCMFVLVLLCARAVHRQLNLRIFGHSRFQSNCIGVL